MERVGTYIADCIYSNLRAFINCIHPKSYCLFQKNPCIFRSNFSCGCWWAGLLMTVVWLERGGKRTRLSDCMVVGELSRSWHGIEPPAPLEQPTHTSHPSLGHCPAQPFSQFQASNAARIWTILNGFHWSKLHPASSPILTRHLSLWNRHGFSLLPEYIFQHIVDGDEDSVTEMVHMWDGVCQSGASTQGAKWGVAAVTPSTLPPAIMVLL